MDVAGLVSSIITFVDFSWTIVRGTYDIHNSASGATAENAHVDNVLQDLQAVTEKMRTDIPGHDDHERALLELEHQCRGLSSDLAAMLEKLTVRRRSGLQSLNTMLRSLMKEKEVRAIERRLGEYRAQMILRLNLILLERSVAMQNSLESRQDAEPSQLRALKHKAEALTSSNSILRRLYFDDMYKRADSITDATYGTFDWLLPGQDALPEQISGNEETYDEKIPDQVYDERGRQEREASAAKISEFLEYGEGVFFLRGKPGSGKSTLMKYLIEGRGKQEVDRKLRRWAGQKRLIRVSAMFLLHGTTLQRSLEGFYRTLFFELLCQCPELEGELFPKGPEREHLGDSYTSSFRIETLQRAWHKIVSIKDHDNIRACVSIDGLDEMEGNSGDRLRFAQTLKKWAELEDIKIICSGRPNAEFNVVFDQPRRLVDLQDLTRPDIRKILEERFEEVRHLGHLTRENIAELVNSISCRSQGVILWAVLIGKSLEDDIIHGQSLATMQLTIWALPSGIEDLFNDMLQQLPSNTQQQLILRTICGLLELPYEFRFALTLSWLNDALSDSEFPYDCPIKTLKADEMNSRLDKVRGLLVQYTRHFVEVGNLSSSDDRLYLNATYRYIHRSAQEFMQSKFNLVGSAQQRLDFDMMDLSIRLNLIFEMSVDRGAPTTMFFQFFQIRNYIINTEENCGNDRFHQLQPRTLEKLQEILDFRRGLLHADSTNGRITDDDVWIQLDICCNGIGFWGVDKRRAVSLFHLAVAGHQVDYITRLLEDKGQGVGREDLCLGLLICSAGRYPSYKLFNLLVDHGADPDCLVEVYRTEHQSTPDLIPLWLLFGFKLAFKASGRHIPSLAGGEKPHLIRDYLHTKLYHEFLILERFLQLGYGSNVQFLAAPGTRPIYDTSDFEPDERDLFGMNISQIIRWARPDNMDRLLWFLDPPRSTFLTLLQELTNFLSQPQFPFRPLPQGATTIPYKRVSDEFLISKGWRIWAAFEGEHEIRKGVRYYVPA